MADIKDIKLGNTKYNIKIPSSRVKSMADYAKPSSKPSPEAIQQSDTLNAALGKLEYKADTNQTNILYGLNTGVRNLMAFTLDDAIEATEQEQSSYPWRGNTFYYSSDSSHTVSFTVNDDYSITVNGSTTTAYNFMFFKIAKMSNFKNCVGAAYINNRFVTNSDGLHFVLRGDGSTSNIVLDSGTDVPNDLTNYSKGLTIRVDANKSFDNVRIYPLVSPKTAFEADNTYKAPALPNSDLTGLEAEDRAALAEEINAGAKNIAKENSFTLVEPSSGNNVYKFIELDDFTAGGNYVISFSSIESTDTDSDLCYFGFDDSSHRTLCAGYATRGSFEYAITIPAGAKYFFMIASNNVANCYNDTLTVTGLMICTLVKWKISQKYVPYRLSYETLGKLKWKRYNITLNAVTFTKSIGGLYYYRFSVSDDFSSIMSVTIDAFSGVVNKGFTTYKEGSSVGLIVYDATDPASLAFSGGEIGILVLGISN